MSERYEHVERAIRDHVAAFNTQDLQRLLAGLAPDVIWQTGEDTFRGHEELSAMFGGAFRALAPKLTIHSLLIDHDRAACELREGITVAGVARDEFIAGFYRVDTQGLITAVKIYRQGSADV